MVPLTLWSALLTLVGGALIVLSWVPGIVGLWLLVKREWGVGIVALIVATIIGGLGSWISPADDKPRTAEPAPFAAIASNTPTPSKTPSKTPKPSKTPTRTPTPTPTPTPTQPVIAAGDPKPQPNPDPDPKPAPKPVPVVAQPAQPAPVARPAQPAPVAQPAQPAPVAQPAPQARYFANCTEAWRAGAAPIYRGQPGYAPHLDRDNDGKACEVRPKGV